MIWAAPKFQRLEAKNITKSQSQATAAGIKKNWQLPCVSCCCAMKKQRPRRWAFRFTFKFLKELKSSKHQLALQQPPIRANAKPQRSPRNKKLVSAPGDSTKIQPTGRPLDFRS
jgi:hypothetical protein